jgi:FixJ family two-component response regulator
MGDVADMERGRLAQDVLDNPVYAEAYDLIEKGIYSAWHASSDKDEREHLHRLLKSLSKVRQVMEGVMTSGQIAAKKLEQEQSLLQRTGRALRSVSQR